MVPGSTSTRWRWFAWAAAAGLPAAAAFVYWVPPTEVRFYPPCLFHLLTGLHCPGCGGTRCVHALLHGDLPQAAAYNVLLLLMLPILLFWGVRAWYTAVTGRRLRSYHLPSWSIALLGVLVTAFWILRNLSFPPFNLLAPHTL